MARLESGATRRLHTAAESHSPSEERPVFLQLLEPIRCRAASLPAHEEILDAYLEHGLTSTSDDPVTRQAQLALEQEIWNERSGISAQQSALSIVVPIHNEERFLDAHLHSLFSSHIPQGVETQFIFVFNDCSDNSFQVFKNHLRRYLFRGEDPSFTETEAEELLAKDPAASPTLTTARLGTLSFVAIETDTPSKANAIHLANSAILRAQHRVGITVDANVFLEPDSIAKLYGEAEQAFPRAGEEPVRVVNGAMGLALQALEPGRETETSIKNPLDKLMLWRKQRSFERQQHVAEMRSPSVNGQFHAFDAFWLEQIGGPPQVAVEDYALGLKAHLEGGSVEFSEARNWCYAPGKFLTDFRSRVRFTRGKLQLEKMYAGDEQALDLIFDANPMGGTLTQRAKVIGGNFVEKLKQRPLRAIAGFPMRLFDLLYYEAARQLALREFKRDPDSSTWDPITDTK